MVYADCIDVLVPSRGSSNRTAVLRGVAERPWVLGLVRPETMNCRRFLSNSPRLQDAALPAQYDRKVV